LTRLWSWIEIVVKGLIGYAVIAFVIVITLLVWFIEHKGEDATFKIQGITIKELLIAVTDEGYSIWIIPPIGIAKIFVKFKVIVVFVPAFWLSFEIAIY